MKVVIEIVSGKVKVFNVIGMVLVDVMIVFIDVGLKVKVIKYVESI